MDWLKNVDKDLIYSYEKDDSSDITDFTNVKLELTPQTISPIAQFFIAPYLLETKFKTISTSIPTNKGINDYSISDIVSHFEDISLGQINNETKTIQFENLKSDSKKLILDMHKTNDINNLVQNLYFNSLTISSYNEITYSNRKFFKVLTEAITSHEIDKESKKIIDFIKDSYLDRYGYFVVRPCNWKLTNSFIESFFVSAFKSIADEIYLIVEDQDILYIYLVKK